MTMPMILSRPLRYAACVGLALAASPVLAQTEAAPAETGGVRVNQIVVYGDDPCPASTDDEIVVCGRLSEDERYRIPEALRGNPYQPTRQSWTSRVESVERIGRFGTDSCSPVGLGGFTGCSADLINRAYQERNEARGTDWTNAVAEARRLRVAGFDAEARAIEEQVERDEAARIAREQAAEAEAQGVDTAPLPAPGAVPPR
ncbi:MAG: hypothetical protein MUF41_00020 [Sphingopyxis sp.]|nr:hypothetical protein [Sphingopyxis sp.]